MHRYYYLIWFNSIWYRNNISHFYYCRWIGHKFFRKRPAFPGSPHLNIHSVNFFTRWHFSAAFEKVKEFFPSSYWKEFSYLHTKYSIRMLVGLSEAIPYGSHIKQSQMTYLLVYVRHKSDNHSQWEMFIVFFFFISCLHLDQRTTNRHKRQETRQQS